MKHLRASPVCLGPRSLKLFHHCLRRGPSCSQIRCGCVSASPSPTSLPLRHSYLCLPVTHISASLLPASRRSTLGILHELCDGHYVTSTAPSPPPRGPSAPVPSSQMAAPDPTQWQPGPKEGILLPCLRLLQECRASNVVTMRWGCGGPGILAASLLIAGPPATVPSRRKVPSLLQFLTPTSGQAARSD